MEFVYLFDESNIDLGRVSSTVNIVDKELDGATIISHIRVINTPRVIKLMMRLSESMVAYTKATKG